MAGPAQRLDDESEAPRAFTVDRERLGVLWIIGTLIVVTIGLLSFGMLGVPGFVIIGGLLIALLLIGLRRDESQPVQVATSADAVHRVLVLAEEWLSGDELTAALRERAGDHGEFRVMVVVPALASRLDQLSGDVDAEIGKAERDAERIVAELRSAGLDVDGGVGDSDPSKALEDALLAYPADEIVVVNPDPDTMGPLQRLATERARGETPVPVTELNL